MKKMELHNAIYRNDIKQVAKLIQNGADVNAPGEGTWTPLLIASKSGYVNAVVMLIHNGANVNAGDNAGWRPIHTACLHEHAEVVQTLITEGADVNVLDKNGWSPLIAAIWVDNAKIFQMLIEAGADIFVNICNFRDKKMRPIKEARHRFFAAFLLTCKDKAVSQMFFDKPHFDENVISVIFSLLRG